MHPLVRQRRRPGTAEPLEDRGRFVIDVRCCAAGQGALKVLDSSLMGMDAECLLPREPAVFDQRKGIRKVSLSEMIAGTGDVYSETEVASWLSETGWRFVERRPLAGPSSLIVAEAA